MITYFEECDKRASDIKQCREVIEFWKDVCNGEYPEVTDILRGVTGEIVGTFKAAHGVK